MTVVIYSLLSLISLLIALISVIPREFTTRNLIIKNNAYVFQQDYIFNSPSAASATILGRSSNGWMSWKDKNGETLDELKRR